MRKKIIALGICIGFMAQLAGQPNVFDFLQKRIDEMRKEFEQMKEEIKAMSEKKELEVPTVEKGFETNKDIKTYYIKAFLPGFKEENIEIKARATETEKFITITAEKTEEKKETKNSLKTESKEVERFETTTNVPQEAIIEKTSWTYENHTLKVIIPLEAEKEKETTIKQKG